jgi:hypothetical protein
MPLTLPYPGYSWSITQHVAPASNKQTLFELLQAAHFLGSNENYQDLITMALIEKGYLTANVREDAGIPQLWRDYQQILPELGLIISTRFTDGVSVTPIGLMWLDGAIGYSELITTQCLRYQYPNGHKQDISDSVKIELRNAGRVLPDTRTELDSTSGVLIKPAVLILRILLELNKQGEANPHLSVNECLSALVPIKTNSQWAIALEELRRIRQSEITQHGNRAKRHIQEWFRLLGLSDLFTVSGGNIYLSELAKTKASDLITSLESYEDPASFWIPDSYESSSVALSWFGHFGTPAISAQWFIPDERIDLDYLEENYPEGIETDETDDQGSLLPEIPQIPSIAPQPYQTRSNTPYTRPQVVVNVERIAQGRKQQERSSKLHEEIVQLLAGKLQDNGYSVYEDKNSVDLLAMRSGDKEAIIEVKTITKRNFSRHIRLGVGQLSEYRYRRELQMQSRPTGILVISSYVNFPSWTTDYFEEDVKLGLVSRSSQDKFTAHTRGELEKLIASR